MARPLSLDYSIAGMFRRMLAVTVPVGLLGCSLVLFFGWSRGSIGWGLVGGVGIIFGLYARFVEPYWFQIVTHSLVLRDGIKRSIRVVFLSDFHTGEEKTRAFYDRLFARVRALNPDLILLGGDYVECRGDSVTDLAGIQTLSPPYGVYFILGNHDYEDDPVLIRNMLTSFGAKDLTDKTLRCGEGDHAFALTGIDDAWLGSPRIHLPFPEPSLPRLLLTHESDILLDLPEGFADLVFLGHTHGGQVRLPGYGSITHLPQSTPSWLDRGLKRWRGMTLLISQGIGESSAPIRFLARPQIIVVDL